MAGTFSIVEKGAPTGVALTALSGGSLTASTTYYYRIVMSGSPFGGYTAPYAQGDPWISQPSTEVSVTTTTTNKQVQIYVDNNISNGLSSQYIGTYRTTTSGNYTQTDSSGTWQKHFVPVTGFDTAYSRFLATSNANCYAVKTMTFNVAITSLSIGETITQTGSGATAIVVSNPAGGTSFNVRSITGTWNTTATTFTGSVTGSVTAKYVSTSAQVGYVYYDTIADSSLLSTPLLTAGLPSVHFYGGTSSAPVTPQDVYDYLVSAGKTQYIDVIPVFNTGDWSDASGNDMCQVFRFKFNLLNDTASGSYFFKVFGGQVVIWLWGKFGASALDTNSTLQIGDIDSNNRTYNSGVWIRNMSYAFYTPITGNMNLYASPVIMEFTAATNNSMVGGSATSNFTDFQFLNSNGVVNFVDSIWQSTGRQITATSNLIRTRMMMAQGEYQNPDSATVSNVTFDTAMRNYFFVSETHFFNVIYVRVNPYDGWVGNQATATNDISRICRYINPTWATSPQVMKTGYNTLATETPYDAFITEEFEVNLNVVDEQGNDITGATLTLTDVNGASHLINPTSVDQSKLVQSKSATTLPTVGSGLLTVGNTYMIATEWIKITAGSGSSWTMSRAQNGTSATYMSDNNSNRYLNIFLVNDSLTSDSSGNFALFRVMNRYWYIYDNTVNNANMNVLSRGPFTITVRASGFKTYSGKVTFSGKTNWQIVLSKSKSTNLSHLVYLNN